MRYFFIVANTIERPVLTIAANSALRQAERGIVELDHLVLQKGHERVGCHITTVKFEKYRKIKKETLSYMIN